MDLKEFYYRTIGGVHKNPHLPYYLHGFAMLAKPRLWTVHQRKRLLRGFDSLPSQEQDEVLQRVNYYCRLTEPTPLPSDCPTLGEQRFRTKNYASVYFFDTYEWNRYFPTWLHWSLTPGDVDFLLPHPSITKSRPIAAASINKNSILINQDKVRHFIFFRDPLSLQAKEDRIIFRGAVHGKPMRAQFFEKFYGQPKFDLQDTSTNSVYNNQMRQRYETSLYGHLKYKYIMSLEGNDVASNLKWVMNSNSLAVSPPMRCETWFMEGTLRPNEHYIEVRPDFSDLLERISYYNEHPAEAAEIVENAHEYCRRFQDAKKERLIALMVMDKYFCMTGQYD